MEDEQKDSVLTSLLKHDTGSKIHYLELCETIRADTEKEDTENIITIITTFRDLTGLKIFYIIQIVNWVKSLPTKEFHRKVNIPPLISSTRVYD